MSFEAQAPWWPTLNYLILTRLPQDLEQHVQMFTSLLEVTGVKFTPCFWGSIQFFKIFSKWRIFTKKWHNHIIAGIFIVKACLNIVGLWYTNVQTSYSGRIANRTGVESGKSENPAGFLGASITPRLTVQILLLGILLHSQLPAESCQFSGFPVSSRSEIGPSG